MQHVSFSVQCIYGRSDDGCEDEDAKEGSELSGGWKRVSGD